MKAKLLLVIVLLLGVSACILETPSTTPSTTESITPTVTPDPKLGSVKGVILERKGGNNTPIENVPLYLAEIKTDGSGKDTGAAMDRINSPRSSTNKNGQFVFSNVPPRRYALVLDRIRNSYMLYKPTDGSNLIIEVKAGGMADLGTLVYENLPSF